MTDLRILAKRGVDWYQLEVYEFEPINLSFEFTRVENINEPTSSYSQRFRVPLTEQNQKIFGPFDWSQVPNFDLKQRTEARILVNGIPILEGFIQLENWYIQKGQFVDIELAFYGEGADLSKRIGDGLVEDLDWASLDFQMNEANITNAWDGGIGSNRVRLGLVDKGWAWDSTTFPNESKNAIKQWQLTPFVRVKNIVDKIFSTAGLTYTSNFLSAMEDLHLCCNKGGLLLPTSDDFRNDIFHVGRLTNTTIAGGGYTVVPMSETGVFYDNGGHWAANQFTAPYGGTYSFRLFVAYSMTNPAETLAWRFNFSVATDVTFASGIGQYVEVTQVMALGEKLQIEVNSTSGATIIAGGQFLGGTSLQLFEFTADTNFYVDVSKTMPTIKSIDFLSGIQKMFNLVFVPDRNRLNHFYIEPFSDYFATGAVKDWTNKIDLEKDITVSTTADLQKRKYTWTHSESTDIANTNRKEAGNVYGARVIYDPNNDFATGELKIESEFSPFITWQVMDTGYAIARLYNDAETITDRQIPDPKPMLAFWNGLIDEPIYYLDDAGAPSTQGYPAFSEFNDWLADVDDDSLNFGHPRARREIFAIPLNGLYYKYWRPWANELYSADARIMRAFFYLDSVDISTFEWSDKIYLKNTYWRVLEIANYDPTTPGVVEVKLVKMLGEIADCSTLPDTGKGGIVQFTPTSATEECCKKYGFEYEATGKCYNPIPL